MNYRLWFNDEHGVLYVQVLRTLTKEDIEAIIPEIKINLDGKPHRYLLGDLSEQRTEDGILDKEARQALRELASDADYDKIAVIGVRPMTMMIAKIGISVAGKGDISRFFKTEDEALTWLKEDKER